MASLIAVISLLLIYVVPRFSEMFESFGAKLPLPTRIVMEASNYAPVILITVGIISAIFIFVLRAFEEKETVKIAVDKLLCTFPVIGALRRRVQSARLANMLSSLLRSGATVVDAIDLCIRSSFGTQIGLSLYEARQDIVEGR